MPDRLLDFSSGSVSESASICSRSEDSFLQLRHFSRHSCAFLSAAVTASASVSSSGCASQAPPECPAVFPLQPLREFLQLITSVWLSIAACCTSLLLAPARSLASSVRLRSPPFLPDRFFHGNPVSIVISACLHCHRSDFVPSAGALLQSIRIRLGCRAVLSLVVQFSWISIRRLLSCSSEICASWHASAAVLCF